MFCFEIFIFSNLLRTNLGDLAKRIGDVCRVVAKQSKKQLGDEPSCKNTWTKNQVLPYLFLPNLCKDRCHTLDANHKYISSRNIYIYVCLILYKEVGQLMKKLLIICYCITNFNKVTSVPIILQYFICLDCLFIP